MPDALEDARGSAAGAAEVTIGVMARAPVAGRCKTRLGRTIGAEGAARLYAAMLADRLAAASALPFARRVVLAAPEDDGPAALRGLAPAGWEIIAQRGADLGARLGSAFGDLLGSVVDPRGSGAAPLVCLVDSDSPALSLASLWPLLARPRARGVAVAGPCEDGGYYLLGMTSLEPGILRDIPWSTSGVMAATRQRCAALGLPLEELPLAYDVDEAADLNRLARDLSAAPALAPRTWEALRALGHRGSSIPGEPP